MTSPNYCSNNNSIELEYDPVKRLQTLEARGLDFADAAKILAGPALTYPDDRHDYGEERWITVGLLDGRMMIVVWTPRGEKYRIVSMRKANVREQEKFTGRLG